MVADPVRAHIPIDLDRKRILCFDHRATFLLMQRFGFRPMASLYWQVADPDDPKKKILQIRSIDALLYFLWAGLQRDADDAGETLSLEQIQEFVNPLTVESIFLALIAALNRPLKKKVTAENAGASAPAEREPSASSTGRQHFDSPAEGSD